VDTFLTGFDSAVYILRITLFVVVVVLAIVCLIDWLVRTRRINPFNPVARYMRSTVDPVMAPVERRIVRAGGMPASAPWWTLVLVVVGTLILVSLLDFIRNQIFAIAMSSQAGVGGIVIMLVRWIFGILRLALIVRIVSSWFGMSQYSKWIRWSFKLTDPILLPLRQVVPTIGVIDITPIIAWFLLGILQWVVLGLLRGA